MCEKEIDTGVDNATVINIWLCVIGLVHCLCERLYGLFRALNDTRVNNPDERNAKKKRK